MTGSQTTLFALASGGSVGHLKEKRFFLPRKPVHVVLRSEHAVGELSFRRGKNDLIATRLIRRLAIRFKIRLFGWVNVGDQLHLKVSAGRREDLGAYLRTLTALLARELTGARKGRAFKTANGRKARFWSGLAFTRVMASRIEEKVLTAYLAGVRIEAQFSAAVSQGFFQMGLAPLPRRLC